MGIQPMRKALADIDQATLVAIAKYRAVGIAIDFLEEDNGVLKVRVKQTRKSTDRVLTSKELYDRAKEALQALEDRYALHILPVTWKGAEIDNVSISWVHSKNC